MFVNPLLISIQVNSPEEVNEKISACFKKMSLSFIDSIKAEECFRKLHQMKDNNIFKALFELVCEQSFSNIQSNQVNSFFLYENHNCGVKMK